MATVIWLSLVGVHDVDDGAARLPLIMLWTVYLAVSMTGVRVQRLVMPSGTESTTVLADGPAHGPQLPKAPSRDN
jgi:hypothetical protein